jgi:hypothetical protein
MRKALDLRSLASVYNVHYGTWSLVHATYTHVGKCTSEPTREGLKVELGGNPTQLKPVGPSALKPLRRDI